MSPTAQDMISAMRSIRHGRRRRWPGKRHTTSKPGSASRSTGIWRTNPGGRAYAPAATPVTGWEPKVQEWRHEGKFARGRLRHTVAPYDTGGLQATAAGLR